jgi:hypothetical protein
MTDFVKALIASMLSWLLTDFEPSEANNSMFKWNRPEQNVALQQVRRFS